MQNSVNEILDRRARSRFFSRSCCCPEKTASVFLYLLIAGALGLYAYLQIYDIVMAYAHPVTTRKAVPQSSITMPGLYLCMPSNNMTSGTNWRNPSYTSLYADPRISFDPVVVTNIPAYPNTPVLLDCCKTTEQDFFTSCFTKALKCPVGNRMLRNQVSSYGAWIVSFDCIQVDPGIVFSTPQDNLWIPFFTTGDSGILAMDANNNLTTAKDDPYLDAAWLYFMDYYTGWPNKMVMFSFLPSENASKPVDIFYGAQDANVGGFQNRIRCDINYGMGSVTFQRFISWDINGKKIDAETGWYYTYSSMFPGIPWNSKVSPYNPQRWSYQNLAWINIRVNIDELQSTQSTSLTFLDLATTIFSIIGSGYALTFILIGPGEYDPNGILNKLFYYDVPTLKNAKSDYAAQAVDVQKSKSANSDSDGDASDDGDDRSGDDD